ncbi:MAG: PaaI family thioesterase, partial [Pseudomonadota bacterium]|nr:PaaI family thioesterase [Pseudomonadota bacterium]
RIPSPASQLLGWTFVAYDREAMTLRLAFDGKPEFRNPAGVIQGGILSAMVDDTFGPLVGATLGRYGVTVDLTTQFLRPVKPGRIETKARILRRGRSVVFLEGDLMDADGKVCVRCTASFFVPEKDPRPDPRPLFAPVADQTPVAEPAPEG